MRVVPRTALPAVPHPRGDAATLTPVEATALVPAPSRLVLWGRSAVLGGAVFATGTVSHLAGGGLLPHPVLTALLLVGAVLVASLLLKVRRSAGPLVLMVVAGQTLAHGLLSTLAGHRGESGPAGGAADVVTPVAAVPAGTPRTGNLLDHYTATYAAPAADGGGLGAPTGWLGHQVDHLVAQGPLMLLAHVGGAVALGLFLAVGEGALWRLLLAVSARARVAVAAAGLVLVADAVRRGIRLARAALPDGTAQVCGPQVVHLESRRRRGPPQLLAA